MIVGVLEVTFHIPAAQSLKDKRKIVRSLKDRIRQRFNVSLAETGGQSTWQSCTLAAASVAEQRAAVERELHRVLDLIDFDPLVETVDHWIDFY